MPETFVYRRRVAFHETDSMGVVHHSNHIKYYEEARVDWLRARGMIGIHIPAGPYTFAVLDLESRYLKTARFEDMLGVAVQARLEGMRILFQYAIWSDPLQAWIATGKTTLVPLGADLRPARLPADVRDAFAREPWSETWPPTNLPTDAAASSGR